MSKIDQLVNLDNDDDSNANLDFVNTIKKLTDCSKYLLKLDDVVIKSPVDTRDPIVARDTIVDMFNVDEEKNIMTESIFGSLIEPNEFRIVSINNKALLCPPTTKPMRKKIYFNPKYTTKDETIIKQNVKLFSIYGKTVANVPRDEYMKVWSNNEPQIYGPGPHVIIDSNIKQVADDAFVPIRTNYISHGIYHIIRVIPNTIALITIENIPYFLTPRKRAYVFREPIFQYVSSVDVNQDYIQHGNYHILRIPKGKVARIWIGPEPFILEHRSVAYIFNDQTFKLVQSKRDGIFKDATQQTIINGSIKRLMPKTGEVAITYCNGNLNIIRPSNDAHPITIMDPNHSFVGYQNINVQTIEFPSDNRKKSRMEENKQSAYDVDLADVNYEVFRTCDGLPIGVKLIVVFEISEPEVTFTRLSSGQILSHIEYLVVADMATVIQNTSSTDFLKVNQVNSNSTVLEFFETIQDKMKRQLCEDFANYGIKLVRLNIETPKILDRVISNKMAELSLLNTETRAKATVLDRQYEITKKTAEQQAIKLEIEQTQQNQNVLSAAKAKMEATRLECDAKLMIAETEKRAKELITEANTKQAELLERHPEYLKLELSKVNSEALKTINTVIVSPEIAAAMYSVPTLALDKNNLLVNKRNN